MGKRKFGESLDLLGLKYNHLTISKLIGRKHGALYYECICDCGNIVNAIGSNVKNGSKKSCGCKNWETKYKPFRDHPLCEVWRSMMKRCYNKNHKYYHRYGGRGIFVCEEWHKYENFYYDNVDIYKSGCFIDRIDNNKGYFKDTVRYVSPKKSGINRNVVKITEEGIAEIKDKNYSAKEISEKFKVNIWYGYRVIKKIKNGYYNS